MMSAQSRTLVEGAEPVRVVVNVDGFGGGLRNETADRSAHIHVSAKLADEIHGVIDRAGCLLEGLGAGTAIGAVET